jgi:CubicO group peptidase (beta-lactamase class C family)
VNAYSVGKGVLAVLFLACVERGELDPDARVADVWPAFAAAGKGDVRIRTLLCHQAGLPSLRERLPDGAMYGWRTMCGALAGQAPWWEPGSARGVAAIYRALVDGPARGGLGIGEALLSEATRVHADGPDRVLGRPSRFGLGFQLSQPTRAVGAGERAFGHFGNGGSLGFADPEADVAFGYLMNRPGARWQTERVTALVDALAGCL